MKYEISDEFRVLKKSRATDMGYSIDKRKRRRQHRRAARGLIGGGTLFNTQAPVGSNPWCAAQWHLFQARFAP